MKQRVLFLFAILCLFPFASCNIKDAEVRNPPLGEKTSVDEILAAYDGALADAPSPENQQPGEATYYVSNYRVEQSSVITTMEEVQRVIQRHKVNNVLELVTNIDRIFYFQDPPELVLQQDVLCFDPDTLEYLLYCEENQKKSDQNIAPTSDLAVSPYMQKRRFILSRGQEIYQNKILDVNSQSFPRVTYHGLEVTQSLEPLPEAVVNRDPNCYGFKDCKIRATTVKYERALWTSETTFEKSIVTDVLSPDTPWLGSLLWTCNYGRLEVEPSVKIVVNFCSYLRDFIPGDLE